MSALAGCAVVVAVIVVVVVVFVVLLPGSYPELGWPGLRCPVNQPVNQISFVPTEPYIALLIKNGPKFASACTFRADSGKDSTKMWQKYK